MCKHNFITVRMEFQFKRTVALVTTKIDLLNWSTVKFQVLNLELYARLHSAQQSRTQSPQAFWSAGGRQERLWNNGISYPRKRGISVLVRMLKIKTEVKCPKMAAVLLLLGLEVLSGLESVRESQS